MFGVGEWDGEGGNMSGGEIFLVGGAEVDKLELQRYRGSPSSSPDSVAYGEGRC